MFQLSPLNTTLIILSGTTYNLIFMIILSGTTYNLIFIIQIFLIKTRYKSHSIIFLGTFFLSMHKIPLLYQPHFSPNMTRGRHGRDRMVVG